MELLSVLIEEASNDREAIWNIAELPVGEALELVGRAKGTLNTMRTLLVHIGSLNYPQDSTSGETPLMSP